MFKSFLMMIAGTVSLAAAEQQFRVTAHYPSGLLSGGLWLRGDRCGLNWYVGQPMTKVTADSWQLDLVCQDDVSQMEMKALINNDNDWMNGASHRVTVSPKYTSTDMYPYFQ